MINGVLMKWWNVKDETQLLQFSNHIKHFRNQYLKYSTVSVVHSALNLKFLFLI